MQKKIDISVIIVNYRTKELTKECIRSVREKTRDVSYEIILVDNASGDGSFEFFEQEIHDVVLIRSEKNLGFGKANNLAAEQAKGEYVFFLNPDTVVKNNALKFFKDTFEAVDGFLGILGARLCDQNGNEIHSYANFKKPFKEMVRKYRKLLKKIFFLEKMSLKRRKKNKLEKNDNRMQYVDYITGADMFMKKELFHGLGGFDRDFFLYYEETELQKRMERSGFKRAVINGPEIVHYVSASLSERPANIKRIMFHVSEVLYMKKVYGKSISGLYQLFFLTQIALGLLVDLYRHEYTLKENLHYLSALLTSKYS